MLHAQGDLLSVAHELAHHLDYLERPGKRGDRTRRHGRRHAVLVDRIAREMAKMKDIPSKVRKNITRDLGYVRRRELNPYRSGNRAALFLQDFQRMREASRKT